MKFILSTLTALVLSSCSTTNRIEALEAERATLIESGLGEAHPKVRHLDAKLLELKKNN